MLIRSKKAQVEEQFNWLFAIIAGGVILLFFLFVIMQIKNAADAKIAAEVLNNFDGVLTGTLASPNTITTIESSKIVSFDVSCESDGTSELSVPNSISKLDINKKIVFAPGRLQGDMLYSYVKPIYAPYYVGNALLLSDSETFFIFYVKNTTSPILNKLYDNIPENVSKTKASRLDQERFKGFRRLIIISTPEIYAQKDADEGAFLSSKKLNYNELLFGVNFSTGYLSTVEFNTWDNGKIKQYPRIVQVPTENLYDYLTFMIYSENLDFYQCSYEKIKQKTRIISKIYAKRAEYLMNSTPQCSPQYQSSINYFNQLSSAEDPLNSDASIGLKNNNQNLLISSCPLIY